MRIALLALRKLRARRAAACCLGLNCALASLCAAAARLRAHAPLAPTVHSAVDLAAMCVALLALGKLRTRRASVHCLRLNCALASLRAAATSFCALAPLAPTVHSAVGLAAAVVVLGFILLALSRTPINVYPALPGCAVLPCPVDA